MSTKKTTGNRWATAVEGAADVLLDTGKSNGGEPSVLPSEEQPQVRIMPVSDPPNLQNKKVPSVQKKTVSRIPSKNIEMEPTVNRTLSKSKIDNHSQSSTKEQTTTAPNSLDESVPEMRMKSSFDPLQQALTIKGRKGRGQQRTYYVDNDVAAKISSLAKELNKSESQLLREVLRAVFKMDD